MLLLKNLTAGEAYHYRRYLWCFSYTLNTLNLCSNKTHDKFCDTVGLWTQIYLDTLFKKST